MCLLLLIDHKDYAKDVKWFAGSKDQETGSAGKGALLPKTKDLILGKTQAHNVSFYCLSPPTGKREVEAKDSQEGHGPAGLTAAATTKRPCVKQSR